MTATLLKTLLIVSAILIIQGCSCPKPKPIYIDRPIEVLVPVKCVVPDANCTFNRETDTEVISSLLECIIDLKKNSEVCK